MTFSLSCPFSSVPEPFQCSKQRVVVAILIPSLLSSGSNFLSWMISAIAVSDGYTLLVSTFPSENGG